MAVVAKNTIKNFADFELYLKDDSIKMMTTLKGIGYHGNQSNKTI